METTIMRGMIWLALATCLAVGTAQAQVAAPSLNPATGGLQALSNPAVQAWEQSRILAGVGEGELDVPASPDDPDADLEARVIQGAWVGETFSAGAERSSLTLTVLATSGEIEVEESGVSLSGKLGEAFALGLGQETEEVTGVTNPEETTLQHAGIAVRLGEWAAVGATYGTATKEEPTLNREAEQDEYRAGIGAQWRDGGNGFHLEAFTGNRELHDDPANPQDEVETTGATLEVLWSGILLGYEQVNREATDATGPTDDVDDATVSLGWVPEDGLTAVVQLITSESTDPATGSVNEDIELLLVSLGWLF